jgi:hypothetical protein
VKAILNLTAMWMAPIWLPLRLISGEPIVLYRKSLREVVQHELMKRENTFFSLF